MAISRGEVPSPSTPPIRMGRLSCPSALTCVPVVFRRSARDGARSNRSADDLCWSERRVGRGEHTFDPSHGGSQGFKSPHLHPKPCRSERRRSHIGGALVVAGGAWRHAGATPGSLGRADHPGRLRRHRAGRRRLSAPPCASGGSHVSQLGRRPSAPLDMVDCLAATRSWQQRGRPRSGARERWVIAPGIRSQGASGEARP